MIELFQFLIQHFLIQHWQLQVSDGTLEVFVDFLKPIEPFARTIEGFVTLSAFDRVGAVYLIRWLDLVSRSEIPKADLLKTLLVSLRSRELDFVKGSHFGRLLI